MQASFVTFDTASYVCKAEVRFRFRGKVALGKVLHFNGIFKETDKYSERFCLMYILYYFPHLPCFNLSTKFSTFFTEPLR